jgi:dTDP-glucose 4,6-dehydratase
MEFQRTVLVTGGCGFIGSAALLDWVPRHPDVRFVNFDALTYAGNPLSLSDLEEAKNYAFVCGDLRDTRAIRQAFAERRPDWVFHFAAESHVDRSIAGPGDFIQTNIVGTYQLLEACREFWTNPEGKLFHHVSTDEVFGSLGNEGKFTEQTPYDPHSPYSASKAASDHLVRAYGDTYGLPFKLTNCSNNYGPRQFPEKLVPLMILNALEGKPLPVYGQGLNVRDWLYVDDHVDAIWRVAERGRLGETYCVGGNCEMRNVDVVRTICRAVEELAGLPDRESLITYVKDRPGHDWRYAIATDKIESELGWKPRETFHSGIRKTVQWYLDHPEWVESVRSGEYRRWIESHYGQREVLA